MADRFVSYNRYFSNEEKDLIYSNKLLEISAGINSNDIMRERFLLSKTTNNFDKALYADFTLYFPDMLLVKVDMASMQESLELRSPFLDHHMIELAAQIPYSLKVKGWCTHKYILKKALEGILPNEILYRQKYGFSIPLSMWFKDSLYSYTKKHLLSNKAKKRNLFDSNLIKTMLESHSDKNDYGLKLWSLLTLELWFQQYFD